MASINCPMTSGTLCIRLISSWARTSSRLRLLSSDTCQQVFWCRALQHQPLFIFYVFFLELDVSKQSQRTTAAEVVGDCTLGVFDIFSGLSIRLRHRCRSLQESLCSGLSLPVAVSYGATQSWPDSPRGRHPLSKQNLDEEQRRWAEFGSVVWIVV